MNVHLIVAVLMMIAASCSFAWSAPVPAHVAEFSVSGSSKPDEMKTTIQLLLLSRLAGEKIATQAKPEGAEIRVTGSYLLSGTMFSLDAAAVNMAGVVIARAFTQGKSPDELIPAVGVLAKSLSEGIIKGLAAQGGDLSTATPSDIIKPVRTMSASGQVVHKLTGAMIALAVGQTLASGERELFVAGSHALRYYRQGSELKLMAEIPYKVYETILAVDSADLDNNGIPEVYVTVMNGEIPVSQIWAVDGTSLKKVAGPLPYYFRAVTGAGGVKKLYAQQISGTADFYGEVSELVKSGEGYKLADPVKLPKQGYIYNFNMLKGSRGESNPVVLDRGGYVKVFNPVGDEIWKSGEEYGGSETSFKRTDRNGDNGNRSVFLEQRIVIKANGELLIPKNSASWFMLSKHSYSNNSLFCFAWDGSNLEEKWHTRKSDYYLSDFAYDESRRELLMLEVVAKEEGVFDKGASRLVIRKVD